MPMPDNCFIKVPADRLETLVKTAFDLSRPQGMGFIHHQPGEMTDEEYRAITDPANQHGRYVANMDYVRGRSVKFRVEKAEDGDLLVSPHWYDHGPWMLAQLLTTVGVEEAPVAIETAQSAQTAYYEQQRASEEG